MPWQESSDVPTLGYWTTDRRFATFVVIGSPTSGVGEPTTPQGPQKKEGMPRRK